MAKKFPGPGRMVLNALSYVITIMGRFVNGDTRDTPLIVLESNDNKGGGTKVIPQRLLFDHKNPHQYVNAASTDIRYTLAKHGMNQFKPQRKGALPK